MQGGKNANGTFDTQLEAVLAHDGLQRREQRPDKANFDASGNRQRFQSSQRGVHWWVAAADWVVVFQQVCTACQASASSLVAPQPRLASWRPPTPYAGAAPNGECG